ncbi:MBL fold metallo-hydrolase [Bacillus bombysepticus]|uniref:MBL fold metallo-hydrolase n=1 Tax=Bacillus bombysepticus TaxID=658666 RepID=UPI00301B2DA9
MDLSFIGTGSALNTVLGNNNALLHAEHGDIFLDCGETNFNRIMKLGLLSEKKEIVVMISHTHSDHIASLGSLVLYSYDEMEPKEVKKIKILVPSPIVVDVKQLLRIYGCESHQYEIVEMRKTYEVNGLKIDYFLSGHVKPLLSFSFVITDIRTNNAIYYSGDSNEISQDILDRFINKEITYIYQDTCSIDFPDNPHLSLNKLAKLIPASERRRVTCMHLDAQFDTLQAEELGFKVASRLEKTLG